MFCDIIKKNKTCSLTVETRDKHNVILGIVRADAALTDFWEDIIMQKNKQKLLCVLDILKETDEAHPITANRIVSRLKRQGIDAERKSVLRDIAALSEYGYDIELHSDNKLGYYLANRDFEDWELAFLCAAASSARFLTKTETERLTNKIMSLSSVSGKKKLKAVHSVKWDNKAENPAVKIYIDKIISAISESKSIEFQYIYTDEQLNKKLKRNGFRYIVSPYSLYWSSDRYYLIGRTENHNNLSCYRLDRMKDLEISDNRFVSAETILGENADLKISSYVQETLYNYSGGKITLQLSAESSAVDILLDYFGDKLRVKTDGERLSVSIRTTESEGLYRWLMQYSTLVTATAPESVVNEMVKRTEAAAMAYRKPCG